MKLNEKQLKNMWVFLLETFKFTDEQNDAIHHQIPMTQEIFDSILDKCEEIGPDADPIYFRIITEYQEFLDKRAKEIEEEMEGFECLELSEEYKEEQKQKLYAKIREKYGEDAI